MTTASRKAAKTVNLDMLVHISHQTERNLQDVDLKVRADAAKKLLQSLDSRSVQGVFEQCLIKLDQRGLREIAVRAVQSADRFTIDAVRRAMPENKNARPKPRTVPPLSSRLPLIGAVPNFPPQSAPSFRFAHPVEDVEEESDGNSMIFVMGGINQESVATSEVYDAANNKWVPIANMNVKRSFAAACRFNGKIYVVGGDEFCRNATAEVFDPTTSKWSMIRSLDCCRFGHALVALDKLIYAIGGTSGRFPLDRVDQYDAEKNEWSPSEQLRQKRTYLAACNFRNGIMVMGGHGDDGALASCEFFDLVTGRWKFAGAMTHPRRGASAASWRDHLFVLGGESNEIECDSVEEYDAKSQIWTEVCGQVNRRVFFGTVLLSNYVYLLGGNSDIPVETFDPHRRIFSDKVRTLPSKKAHFAVCDCEVPENFLAMKEKVAVTQVLSE